MAIARFMATPIGRGLRIVLGLALIVAGLATGGTVGWIVSLVGIVPIVAGAANLCLLAPILGAPLKGSDVR